MESDPVPQNPDDPRAVLAEADQARQRMAAGLRCPWIACYVDATTRAADRTQLDEHLRRAEKLGATVTQLSGTAVADALLQYARKHNVTRLIIGKPTHARWRDRLRGSLLNEVVRGSGDIDVHVIRGDSGDDASASAKHNAPGALPACRVPEGSSGRSP